MPCPHKCKLSPYMGLLPAHFCLQPPTSPTSALHCPCLLLCLEWSYWDTEHYFGHFSYHAHQGLQPAHVAARPASKPCVCHNTAPTPAAIQLCHRPLTTWGMHAVIVTPYNLCSSGCMHFPHPRLTQVSGFSTTHACLCTCLLLCRLAHTLGPL